MCFQKRPQVCLKLDLLPLQLLNLVHDLH
jgi:hypothetical protein